MPEITRSRLVAAPRDRIWDLVSDPFNLPRWWPATVRVEDVEDGAWTSVLKTPKGATVRADYTRAEFERGSRVGWQQELEESPFERVFASASTTVALADAPDGGGTRVELTVAEELRGRYRFGGWVIRRAARRRLDEALTSLAEAVE
jgi:uncharacterized protein YndB with AHSA1/START domain